MHSPHFFREQLEIVRTILIHRLWRLLFDSLSVQSVISSKFKCVTAVTVSFAYILFLPSCFLSRRFISSAGVSVYSVQKIYEKSENSRRVYLNMQIGKHTNSRLYFASLMRRKIENVLKHERGDRAQCESINTPGEMEGNRNSRGRCGHARRNKLHRDG